MCLQVLKRKTAEYLCDLRERELTKILPASDLCLRLAAQASSLATNTPQLLVVVMHCGYSQCQVLTTIIVTIARQLLNQ